MTDGAILLKARDVAVLLGCAGKPSEVYRMASSRVFPEGVMVKIGRRLRFSRPKLEQWLRDQGALPEPGPVVEAVPAPMPVSRGIECPNCGCAIRWSTGGCP